MIMTILTKFADSASVNCLSSTTGGTGVCSTGLPKVNAGSGELHSALTIVFGIAAVISVLMIVIGGLMFITSGGNEQNVKRARETLIYAVVGLVISLLAEIIVAFVLGKISL
ncbi:MAG: hypothetical protein WDN66_01670 [Candidatus Saccharibacteria bacterium]